MKVLVISHTYIASINREKWKVFAKQYSNVQLKVLIPKTWNGTLFNLKAGEFSKYNLENCEFIAIDTFKSGNEVLYGYKFRELIKLLRSFKPDIIHVEQGDNAFSYFQVILLSRLFCRNAKFVFFTWVNWKAKFSLKYKLFWGLVEKFNLYFSSGAIVGNDDAGNVLRDKKFRKPIEALLQLGVNRKFFYPAKKVKKKLIGYVGRLIDEKGIFNLVDAFSLLSKDFSEWKLLFVGEGEAKKRLINYVYENKLMDRIEIRDSVSHERVAAIINDFEIFVLPSYDTVDWKEQFGHVLIEAMACKVALIGSDAGQIPHVIGNAGLVFEQKNVKCLASCLKQLMDNEELRKQLGEKGYKRFEDNYSYEIIAKKTYSFWNKFI